MINYFFRIVGELSKARRHASFTTVVVVLIVLCFRVQAEPISTKTNKDVLAVGLTGVQHIGENFNISEFYVNRSWGGNVGREGGGGGNVCCVMLPMKWRPGLVAEVRWSVGDWSNEKKIETKVGNYRSIVWKNYRAIVPIEEYESAEDLYVHFFPKGKVRAVSSIFGSEGRRHPIRRDDPKAVTNATTGYLTDSMFTVSELEQIKKEDSQEISTEGNWK